VHSAVLIFSFTAIFSKFISLPALEITIYRIACVQVVYAVIFAALILGEWLSWNVVAGGLIVVSAAIYESLPKKRN
jgi:drug/metabolite transporter (DMT)-like permease